METDILIVGGGPAGLCAAYESARLGLKVTIVDESFHMGGQLKQQTQVLDLPVDISGQTGQELADYLVNRLRQYDVEFLSKHTMAGTYKNGNIGVTDGISTTAIQFMKAVIATGAAENPIAFPGWTLPGVLTIGAAQILMNRENVLPGEKAVVVGLNSFSMEVVEQLHQNGVDVLAIIEKDSAKNSGHSCNCALLEKMNIPVFYGATITQASGSGEVQKVLVEHQGRELEFDANLVCISGGLSPILEPFQILGCELTYQEALGGWLPKYDENFKTSVPFIYVAGNAAGITTMKSIILTGYIAGLSAASDMMKQSLLAYKKERKEVLHKALLEAEYEVEAEKGRLNLLKETGRQSQIDFPKEIGGL